MGRILEVPVGEETSGMERGGRAMRHVPSLCGVGGLPRSNDAFDIVARGCP